MNKTNEVKSCIIFLVSIEELKKTSIAPQAYFNIIPDEALLPALKKFSAPGKIKTISFMAGKFLTLLEAGAGGKIMVFSLKKFAEHNITLPAGTKNHDNLEILAALGRGKEIGAVIYFPD